MLRAKLEAMRNKNVGDKTDETLWGEDDEDAGRKKEAMPGDVVSKEVRTFYFARHSDKCISYSSRHLYTIFFYYHNYSCFKFFSQMFFTLTPCLTYCTPQ